MSRSKRKNASEASTRDEEELKYFIARRDLVNLVLRYLEIIARFGQYRLRELVVRGLNINYDMRTEVDARGQVGGDANYVR